MVFTTFQHVVFIVRVIGARVCLIATNLNLKTRRFRPENEVIYLIINWICEMESGAR